MAKDYALHDAAITVRHIGGRALSGMSSDGGLDNREIINFLFISNDIWVSD